MYALFQAEGGGSVTSSDLEGVSSRKVGLGGRITRNFLSAGCQIGIFFPGRGRGLCLAPARGCQMPRHRPGASPQVNLYWGLS